MQEWKGSKMEKLTNNVDAKTDLPMHWEGGLEGVAADLAEEEGLGRVCRVHSVLVHPAGPGKAPFGEAATCLGAHQAATTLNTHHMSQVILHMHNAS